MSSITRIWPSQAVEAPIPMVGILIAAVMRFASGSVSASSTTAKAPASATWRASSTMAAHSFSVRPCALKPPMTLTDWGVRPMCDITGMPRSTR